MNMKIELTYNYFTATLTGYNGSRGTVLAKASGCWNTEAEAEAALDESIRAASEEILERNGYGFSTHTEAELRDVLSDKLERETAGLDEGEVGELDAEIKAAAEKYGQEIPVSCGALGVEFGDQAESEDDLLDWAISHDHQRLATTYSVTPIYDGRLIHDLKETLNPGDLPSWDARPDDVIKVLQRRYEIAEDAEIEVVEASNE